MNWKHLETLSSCKGFIWTANWNLQLKSRVSAWSGVSCIEQLSRLFSREARARLGRNLKYTFTHLMADACNYTALKITLFGWHFLSKKSKEHHNSHRRREFERDVRMCVFMWTWKDKPYWQHGRCSPQGTERDGDRSLTAVWWREMRPGTVPEGTHHIQINDFIQPHT